MPDVTVIGGGLAGLAAAIHLSRIGLRVVCIEPQGAARQPVGESLDWSTPGLLSGLGLSMADVIGLGFGTYKKGVTLQSRDGGSQKYFPKDWLSRPPFNVELRTLHVDRVKLDRRLMEMACDFGIQFIQDRVVAVERSGARITGARTARGDSYKTPWFVDASGFAASLLAREFALESIAYGPRKVAIWTYFSSPLTSEGTTIYAESGAGGCLEWIWEIPISPEVVSVGCVGTADQIKEGRKQGQSVEDIFSRRLSQFPHFEPLLSAVWHAAPRAITFRCRTFKDLAGPNWILIGEAASVVDPITSNGATAALRHAEEASALIAESRNSTELPPLARRLYSRRVMQMSAFFNCGIDKLVYDWPVRRAIGLAKAARAYTIGAWTMNAIYSRTRPRGFIATSLFGQFLGILKGGAYACHAFCKWFARSSRKPG